MSPFYPESFDRCCQVHSHRLKTTEASFFLEALWKKWQCGPPVCLPSGQFVWEGAEEVLCVASYLERGHLAWLADNSPTAQRAAVSQVLMQTVTCEHNRKNENRKEEEWEGGKTHKLLFSRVRFHLLVLLFPPWCSFSRLSCGNCFQSDVRYSVGFPSLLPYRCFELKKSQCLMHLFLQKLKWTTLKNSNRKKKRQAHSQHFMLSGSMYLFHSPKGQPTQLI